MKVSDYTVCVLPISGGNSGVVPRYHCVVSLWSALSNLCNYLPHSCSPARADTLQQEEEQEEQEEQDEEE